MQILSTSALKNSLIGKTFVFSKRHYKYCHTVSALSFSKPGSRIIIFTLFFILLIILPLNPVLTQDPRAKPNFETPLQKTKKTEFIEEIKRVDINTAPLEELAKIIHIGEKRAQELISLRPFYSLDELTKIKGIGEKKLKDIKKQGLAWVDPNLKPPEITETKKELVAINKSLKPEHLDEEIPASFSLFLIAFSLAIFSGIIILILKKKIKKSYNRI